MFVIVNFCIYLLITHRYWTVIITLYRLFYAIKNIEIANNNQYMVNNALCLINKSP